MRVAIMQPYFFPYLPYFHLIDAVDIFVVLDNVQFPKGGWVNRNKVLIQGKEAWVTVPTSSSGRSIREKSYIASPYFFRKFRATMLTEYSRAPGLQKIFEITDEWESLGEREVSRVNMFLIGKLLTELGGRRPKFLNISCLKLDPELRGQERVVAAAKELAASQYVNLPGGQTLYQAAAFEKEGIELKFVSSDFPPYPQQSSNFVPGLSVLDMALRSPEMFAAATRATHYKLISANV